METRMLAFKRQKGTITAADYIAWSHSMLEQANESPSLQMMTAFTSGANLFEIEAYFQRALDELGLQLPILEPNSIEAIQLLAKEILRATDDKEIVQLAYEIFHIVVELNYPNDLMNWYEISEMWDRLTYDSVPPSFNQQEVIHKIREVARKTL